MSEVISKLKNVFGFDDDDDYEDENQGVVEEYDEEESVPAQKQEPTRSVKSKKSAGYLTSTDMTITVHEPLSYDESPKIVDDLRNKKAVVLNFEQLDIDIKREIFDFVSGALYAIDGKIQKVNKDIFILAPNSIEINGLKEELKNTGMFPW